MIYVNRNDAKIPVEPMIGETVEECVERLSAIHGPGTVEVVTDTPAIPPEEPLKAEP